MNFVMKIILIVIFILIISTVYKKAQKKGLRTYHFVVLFLTSPFTVFLDNGNLWPPAGVYSFVYFVYHLSQEGI